MINTPSYFLGRRRLSLNKTADSFTAAELDQVRTLEEEKLRLQRQLQDAKGALDAYAGKLGQQQVNHSYNQVSLIVFMNYTIILDSRIRKRRETNLSHTRNLRS